MEVQFDSARFADMVERSGMTDAALARKAGISRSMVGFLRKGQRKSASAEILTKLAGALGTTTDYFLGSGEMPPVQVFDDAIRRLVDIANGLPEGRQAELLQMALALQDVEQDRNQRLPKGTMGALLRLSMLLKERDGNDDLLVLLNSLMGQGERYIFGLGDSGENGPDEPGDGDE